jgi:hypothetical protein
MPTIPNPLPVPRHIQDYHFYCGPASVMMILATNTPAYQSPLLAEIRDPLYQDPFYCSSAEGLVHALAFHGSPNWLRVFHINTNVSNIVYRILKNLQVDGLASLVCINSGAHWVVAFGYTIAPNSKGAVATIMFRDPARDDLPTLNDYLITFPKPDTSTASHSNTGPCGCLKRQGLVVERAIATAVLTLTSGTTNVLLNALGGMGNSLAGALGVFHSFPKGKSILPVEEEPIVELYLPAGGGNKAPEGLTPQVAALNELRSHGLMGGRDSPPDWKAPLEQGRPGVAILVKSPDGTGKDYYLVPIREDSPTAKRSVWVMLDAVTLKFREAALLENWTPPVFPTDEDATKISLTTVTLSDGTKVQFKKSDLQANRQNLVWKASTASLLPYAPLKEFTAPHPTARDRATGKPLSVPIYMTQRGAIYTVLQFDDPAAKSTSPRGPQF